MRTNNLSIKKIIEQRSNETNFVPDDKNQPKNDFSYDQVKMYWRQFAHDSKSKGMETLYNAMIKREPRETGDFEYTMDVDNEIQIQYITPLLQNIVSFMRENLKNYNFNLKLFLTENQAEETKFLTGKDRFESMARKNPNLHSLKTIFNLDIEF